MRIARILPILTAALFVSPLAAQEAALAHASTSIQPLPPTLAPVPSFDGRATAMDPVETGALTGILVGATLGGVYGAFFADECGVEDECMLSREVKTVSFVAIGGGLGGIIGLGTSFLLNRRASRPEAAPLRVAGTADGGVRVGVVLRH